VAIVESGSQALRLGTLNIGAEFTTSSVYSSDAGAYFLLPTAYNALIGEEFDPQGPGIVPESGTVEGWAKYSYDGTPHFTFTGLDVDVEDWTDAVAENDAASLLEDALSGNDILTGGGLADELLGFAGDDDLFGVAGNDTLRGDAGNDDLDGGAGSDTMTGGDGDDTYIVDNVGDRVIEALGEGTDSVSSSIAYTLGANVENLTLTGTAAINGTGNTLPNSLTGNSGANVLAGGDGADALAGHDGNDTLNGGPGADAMTGGDGNDAYVVDDSSDGVVELADKGTDAVTSSVTHDLAANVENLTLIGTAAINGTGNDLVNRLTGNVAANTLDGGSGADVMAGGAGNDVYVVDETGDTVTEALSAGTDTVQSAVPFILGANVENLTLVGAGNIAGTGNTLANILVGNTGENTLNGGGGADMMFGGGGDDGYFVDNAGDRVVEIASGGRDRVTSTISHTLAAEVEDLTLTPGTAAINGTGNAGDNALMGNAGANVLAGGAGDDSLDGGAGIDTMHGGDGSDTLDGDVGNDTLRGDAGDDTLDGGLGADAMTGGDGNDTYHIDNVGDRVTELVGAGTGTGTDTVESTISYTLTANVENLTLTGTAAINGTGNALDNVMTGNAAINVLSGGDGNDVLGGGGADDILIGGAGDDGMVGGDGADTVDGGAGTDIMSGGAGADTFLFALGFGEDTISSWEAGDKISLDADLGSADFAALDNDTSGTLDDADALVAVSAGDMVIDFGEDVLTIEGVTELGAGDFTFVA
jgi:Ca2+-binding RTX toxin-like protein